MAKIAFFVERNNGDTFYKMDTFWSKSKDWTKSKLYGMLHIDKKDWSILTSYDYVVKELLDSDKHDTNLIIELHDGCKLGYREIDDSIIESHGYTMKPDSKEEELGRKIYTHQITMDGMNKPKIEYVEVILRREEALKQILN